MLESRCKFNLAVRVAVQAVAAQGPSWVAPGRPAWPQQPAASGRGAPEAPAALGLPRDTQTLPVVPAAVPSQAPPARPLSWPSPTSTLNIHPL